MASSPTAAGRWSANVGRIAASVSVVLAILTARPLLGSFDQAFQYIQEFTGFLTPGITVIFLFGLFWKPATEAGAIVAAITSVLLSYILTVGIPASFLISRDGKVCKRHLGIAPKAQFEREIKALL